MDAAQNGSLQHTRFAISDLLALKVMEVNGLCN